MLNLLANQKSAWIHNLNNGSPSRPLRSRLERKTASCCSNAQRDTTIFVIVPAAVRLPSNRKTVLAVDKQIFNRAGSHRPFYELAGGNRPYSNFSIRYLPAGLPPELVDSLFGFFFSTGSNPNFLPLSTAGIPLANHCGSGASCR